MKNRPLTILASAMLVLTLAACSGKKDAKAGEPVKEATATSSKPNPWASDAPPAEPTKAAEPAAKPADAKPKKNPWAKDTAPQVDEAAAEKPAK